MIFYDSWHTLEVEHDGQYVGGHNETCPTFPAGPEPGDIDYGCPTSYNLLFYGFDFFEELADLKEGSYRIRYWSERSSSYFGDELEDGMELEKTT